MIARNRRNHRTSYRQGFLLHWIKEIEYTLDEQHQMYLNRLHHIAVEREEYEHHYHWLDDSYLHEKKEKYGC